MVSKVLPGAGVSTWVVADELLFVAVLSVSFAFTVAVLVSVAGEDGAVTVMVNTWLAPFASGPTVHVTVPEEFAQPADADWNASPAGSVSGTLPPLESSGRW